VLWESVAEPTERFPACHCSTILELDGGDLLVGYYAGSGEAKPDAAWVVARKGAAEATFGPPRVVADTPGKPEGNGFLFQDRRANVVVVYGTMHGKLDGRPGPGVRWVTCDLRMKSSEDGGTTWSDVEVFERDRGHVPRCKPIRLRGGEILFGTEYKDGQSRIWSSEDDGRTWKVLGRVPGEPNQHPSLLERDDGGLLALLRPAGGQRCVLRSTSSDGGRSWSETRRTELESPFAALDAVRLSDGRMVLCWNQNPKERNPLTLAMSEDGGETWPYVRDLVTGEGQFHYPAVIQSENGLLHVAFTNNRRTIDHVVLSPGWIAGEGKDLPPWRGQESARVRYSAGT